VPVVRAVLLAVDEIARVVAGAVGAAVAEQVGVGKVGANLLGAAPKVVEPVLFVGQNGAVGDEDAVGPDALAGKGQAQRVVERGAGRGIGKRVEVPVKKIINGAKKESLNAATLQNPEVLAEYERIGAELRADVEAQRKV